MQKKFYGSLILIILLNVLVKPIYIFAIDAQVQNTVGSADYGVYFSLLNFSFLFNIVLDIGITNYNTKNIAQHPNTVSKYIGSILGLRFLLAIGYFTITIGSALLIGYNDLELEILSILALNQILVGFILYFRSNFSGLHWFKTDAFLSVLDRLLLICIGSVLLYSSWIQTPFQIEWFVYAQTVSYTITALVAFFLTLLRINRIKLRINHIISRAILRKSYPYALYILLMMLYTRMDAVMIERLLQNGKVQAGVYAQGYRLLDMANVFAFLIAGLLLPIFARLIKNKGSIKPVLQSSALFLIGSSLLIAIIGGLFSQQIMEFIYRQDTHASSQSFFWIILSFIPIATGHIFGTLLTANGSMQLLNRIATMGIAVNFILNFILIPIGAAEGAAISTLFTQSVTVLLQIFYALRIFKLRIEYQDIFRLLIFSVSLIGFYHLTVSYLNNWIGFFTMLIMGIVLLLILRIVNLREILKIIRG